ncbi:MAG: PspA/IM30 family protein [Phycisphaerae bacterium]|nr:PspA/IM30 family protein [Phycisphaerae bacterium]
MGIFKRLQRITPGRIETYPDKAETPETLFPVLIDEMQQQLKAATSAEAKATVALKQATRDLEKHLEKVDRFGNGALLAMKKGDEETARMSVEDQIEVEKTLDIAQKNVDCATDSLDHATASRKKIQTQLDELSAKKDEILTRARVAKTQQKIQRTVSGSIGSTDSILDAVARLESGVEEAEAQLEVQANLAGDYSASPTLERKLDELSHESEIENRLKKIRQEIVS